MLRYSILGVAFEDISYYTTRYMACQEVTCENQRLFLPEVHVTSAVERYVAFDLGAESGRTILGTLTDDRLQLQEISRFANGAVRLHDSLHWDVLRLWEEIKHGLAQVVRGYGRHISGIGVDTWGADFALLDQHGALLGVPFHYRDKRTVGILEQLQQYVTESDLYAQTGLSYFEISTLCQLLAMRCQASPALDVAHTLLLMADLFNFWLSGSRVVESTLAGVSQLYHLGRHDWHRTLLDQLNLPTHMLPDIVPAGTVLGPLLPSVAEEVGLSRVPVVAPACHDTLAATAAVPSLDSCFTFISCGTWSVIGTELGTPILTAEALAKQFFNEVAACGKILLAMNSTGLWPLQECRRQWLKDGHGWSYDDLTDMAVKARPLDAIIDPDAAALKESGDMTAKIAALCCQTGQQAPAGPGEIVRALLEGLALRYRKAIEDLDAIVRRRTKIIHIIGGGSQNRLLCQMTADATGRPVIAGPREATATGTVLLQALALRRLTSLQEIREVVRRSFALSIYEPQPAAGWDEAYARFLHASG